MPMIRPPTIAPGTLPKPPTTAAGNAFNPMKPMFECTKVAGASKMPANAATPADSPQTSMFTRLTGIPIYAAASWFCEVACIATPSLA